MLVWVDFWRISPTKLLTILEFSVEKFDKMHFYVDKIHLNSLKSSSCIDKVIILVDKMTVTFVSLTGVNSVAMRILKVGYS